MKTLARWPLVLALVLALVPLAVDAATPNFNLDGVRRDYAVRGATAIGTLPAVTGLTVVEGGAAPVHHTTLKLASVAVATVDNSTSGANGSLLVYTFPEGIIHVVGCVANLTTVGSGGITATSALVGAVGTAASGADATLTSTEANLVPSMAGTLVSSAGTFTGFLAASAKFDGHSAATPMYLNVATVDAGSTGNGSVAVSGSLICDWMWEGDY